MVLVTERHIQRARTGGACREAMQAICVGQRVDSLEAEWLGWILGIIPQSEVDDIASEMADQIMKGIDPYLLGVSGFGSGDGSGDGDGSGYG